MTTRPTMCCVILESKHTNYFLTGVLMNETKENTIEIKRKIENHKRYYQRYYLRIANIIEYVEWDILLAMRIREITNLFFFFFVSVFFPFSSFLILPVSTASTQSHALVRKHLSHAIFRNQIRHGYVVKVIE